MKQSFVTAPDGVRIAIYEDGNPDGPEILFIHGFSQCALCWKDLFASAELAGRFRLTAFDIRGHGASDKPLDGAYYRDDRIFAEDIKAVMDALGLARPVLVAWSYAGRLVSDYVSVFGTSRISGINYVCARTSNDPAFNGPGTDHIAAMIRDDEVAAATATRAFVGECFAVTQPVALLDAVYDYNMTVPTRIRSHHIRRPSSDGAILSGIDVPVLVSQGSEDRLVLKGLAEWTAKVISGAELSIYQGIGHSPFVEDRLRFERELAAFVARASH
jgi:pimeloyl-ACP methyl ester carboxylesterase